MNPVMEFLTPAQMLLFFGIASGVLSTFAFIPYILDTIAGRTEPQRASWLIWSVLGSIAFVSQVFEGATTSLWFAGVQISGTIIVFLLSIRVGKGRYLSKLDYVIIFAAAVGLVLWYLTDTAAYALAITISISLLGGMATVVKAYHDPESETLITWVVSLIASACAILSVGAVDFTLLAYPLYLFTLYLAFVVAIVMGRTRVQSGEQTTTRSMRPLSFAMLTSGLRTAADVVIVGAAFFFAFNWLGTTFSVGNVFAVGTSTIGELADDTETRLSDNRFDEVSSKDLHLLSVPVASLMERSSVDAASPALPTAASILIQEPAFISTLSSKRSNNVDEREIRLPEPHASDTQIIVVVVGWAGSPESAQGPLILHDSDPVAILAKSQVRDWLDGEDVRESSTIIGAKSTAWEFTEKQYSTNSALPEVALKTRVETEVLATHTQKIAVVSPELTSPATTFAEQAPYRGLDYLLLDADDPFAKLVVTSDTAVLARESGSRLSQTRVQPGQRLLALATNGEWFKVHVDDGPGYIHRSEVSVEVLSSFLARRAG